MRKALVRDLDGVVENVVEWEEDSAWPVPDGRRLIDGDGGSPGDTWDGSQFVKPALSPSPDANGFIQAALDSLGADRADELMRQYPTFLPALERSNWTVARGRLDKALADGNLSQAEYDNLTALMDQHHIPNTEA